MSQQRFAVLPALCGTLFLVGWVAGLAGLGAGIHNRAPIEAATPQATATAEDGRDGISVSDRPSVDAALPDPVRCCRLPRRPCAIAPASTPDPVQDDVAAAAPPVDVAAIGSVGAALPDPRPMLPPATPPVAIAPASTPDPVQDDVAAAAPAVEVAAIAQRRRRFARPSSMLPPATPPVAIAPASTPDPVQDDVAAAAPAVEVAAIGERRRRLARPSLRCCRPPRRP